MDIDELRILMGMEVDAMHKTAFSSQKEARKTLNKFIKKPNIKVGDFVKPNKFGFGLIDIRDDQEAIVMEIFDTIKIDDDGDAYDCIIAIARARDDVQAECVLLNHIEKADSLPENLIELKRHKK